MIIVNTDYISGKEIETIQLVKGSIVFSKNVVRDVFAGLKTIIVERDMGRPMPTLREALTSILQT